MQMCNQMDLEISRYLETRRINGAEIGPLVEAVFREVLDKIHFSKYYVVMGQYVGEYPSYKALGFYSMTGAQVVFDSYKDRDLTVVYCLRGDNGPIETGSFDLTDDKQALYEVASQVFCWLTKLWDYEWEKFGRAKPLTS